MRASSTDIRQGFERWQQGRLFNIDRRVAFYKDMANFMHAGIPPYQGLNQMRIVGEESRKTRKLAGLYARMLKAMDAGQSFAAAVARQVPSTEATVLVAAGEAGDKTLHASLVRLGGLLTRQRAARNSLKKALIKNGGFIGAILGVMIMIVKVVVPQLEATVTPEMKPLMNFAPAYFKFGFGLLHYGPWVGAVIAGLLVAAFVSLPRWHTRPRPWLDEHVMPWSFYLLITSTLLLTTISTMLKAGMPMQQIISNMESCSGAWLSVHLRAVLRRLSAGVSEVDALTAAALPRSTRDRLRIYRLIPDFGKVMEELSEDSFSRYEARVERLAKTLGTIGMILTALFAASTLLAVFDFSNALQASVKIH